MIYLDNAATGGFKIRAVTDAAENIIRYLSANPGRSGHRLSVTGAKIVYSCRERLADFFGGVPEKVIFTKNCTEALNIAIFGTIKKGGKILTTAFEHNSVLRPLTKLKQDGLCDFEVINPDSPDDLPGALENRITDDTYLIIATTASNVTGQMLPVKKIGEVAKNHGLLFLADGAQGGGHIPLDIKADNISLLALAGHKALGGIMGSGALLIGDGVEVSPLIYGGTGTESFNLNQPEAYPEKLESGTLNLPAIAALSEGVRYVKENIDIFPKHLYSMTDRLVSSLQKINGVTVYSAPNKTGIVSFNIKNLSSGEVADILSDEYDIAVRAGMHCAPLMHKRLNTEDGGTVRASLSVQNTSYEVDALSRAVKKIAETIRC